MRIFISFISIVITLNLHASNQYYFRHYNIENGLSNNTVLCSIQDKMGFIWFGTRDGLNRFDGNQFKNFMYDPENPNSLINNFITALAEDNEGLIWIGTSDGICYYNPHKETFGRIQNTDITITKAITDIKIDAKDNIWVTSYSGIFRYNKKENKLINYPQYKYFNPSKICITSSENVWISSDNGNIYRYDLHSDDFIEYKILKDAEISSNVRIISITDLGVDGLMVITNKSGVRKLDTNTGKLFTLFSSDKNGNEIVINTILKKNQNEFWIGSESGIHIYHLKGGLLDQIQKLSYDPYSLSNNAIRTFTVDNEGGIWVGTFYGGINYLPNEITPFDKYYHNASEESLLGNVVRSIQADKYGNLWIGTEDAGLSKFNTETEKFINYLELDNPKISSTNIHCVLPDNDKLWIGSYDAGIYILDINTNKLVRRFESSNRNSVLKNNSIITFLKTRNGSIYVGTVSGMYFYDRKKDDLVYLSDVAPHEFIHCLYEDHEGVIWIGTYGEGVFRYDRSQNICYHYNSNPADSLSLSSDYITSIFEDNKKHLWFTTEGNGFCMLDSDTALFKRYTTKDGLHCSIFCGILEDGLGQLWISSTNGLMSFDPETKAMNVYRKENGIVNNHFSYNSTYKDNNGKMYFGTLNGFIAFNPFDFNTGDYIPPVYVTNFEVAGKKWNQIKKKHGTDQSIIETKEIKLKHNQSTFNLNFVAPSFSNPMATKYRYKLEGFDKDWIYPKDNGEVYYKNVSPGKYRFRVTTLNQNSEWNNDETNLVIIITKPFWATNFALIIYSLLIIFLSYVLFNIYSRRKRQEHKRRIEKLENEKEKEILNAKINFFTNITHEVRTPLTLIKAPLDRILTTENFKGPLLDNLSIMKHNTDRLLDLTNQLLDFRKTENEMFKLNFSKTDICKLLENTFSRFRPGAAQKNLNFNIHNPVEHYYVSIDQETVIKIISNILSNALKYASNNVDVYIEPDVPDESSVTVRVNSDGNIIPKQLSDKIFEPFFQIENTNHNSNTIKGTGLGLPLARSLAELHYGKLYLDLKVENLNSFVLELPKSQKQIDEKETSNPEVKTIENIKISQDIDIEPINDNRPIVLIVDDEKELCSFVATELSSKYKTTVAHNGLEAVKILKNNPVTLVVSDVLMPLMDGYELCNFIKSNLEYSHIPVILLTATINLNAKIEGLESGADAYIEKPFTVDLLFAQISNLIKNRELANENFLKYPLTHYKTVAVNKMDEDFMKQLHSTIMKHLAEPELSVEKIANLMNVSISTLYRKVKAITELNTNEYIRFYRLKRAAEMLASNEHRINEVSYLVGFSSPSYFATSFQKQFGMSPSEFMKQMKVKA